MALAKDFFNRAVKLVQVAWAARRAGNSDFQPFESVLSLVDSAGIVVTEAVNNLNDAGYPPSSTKLSKSLKVEGPARNGYKVKVNVMAFDYYKYVNQSTHSAKGSNNNNSRKQITATAKQVKKAKKISGIQAKKQNSISAMNTEHAMSQSILQKRNGSGFFDKAVATGRIYAEENLRRAFTQDIINSLEKL